MHELLSATCATFRLLKLNFLSAQMLLLGTITPVLAQVPPAAPGKCLALQGSTACPSFSQYTVFRGSNLTSVTFNTVADFDNFIMSKLINTQAGLAAFKKDEQCPNLVSTQEIRYLQSTWCATMIDTSTKTYGCNSGVTIKQLCRTSAQVAVASINNITSNSAFCTQGARTLSPYNDLRQYIERGSSTAPDCLVSLDIEKTCGFASTAAASAFCASSSDPCCAAIQPSASIVSSASANTNATNATSTADASSSETTAAASAATAAFLNPMTIGIGAGCIALVLIAGIVLFVMSRRRRQAEPAARSAKSSANTSVAPSQVSETLHVIYEYTSNLFDEISLNVGDHVVVKAKFDDGWAFGFNINTKQEGSFPLACVGTLEQLNENRRKSQARSSIARSDGQSEPRDSWMYSRRISSLVSPPELK